MGKGLPLTLDIFQQSGTLLWTRTLGTIVSYFQKPTKASREYELHGHARKLRATLLKHGRFWDADGDRKRTFRMPGQWCLPDFCTNLL